MSGRPARSPAVRPPWADLLLRAVAAFAGGLLLWLSFPDHNLWWAAPIGVACMAAAVLGTRLWGAFGFGLVGGLAYFVPTLSWSGVYVGHLPWFALATVEALYVAAMCVVMAWVWARLRPTRWAPLAYAVVPLAWVIQETLRGSTPFGGFPWARLAFSQADSPLARLAAYGGAPLVTFAVALTGTGLLLLVHAATGRSARLVAAGLVVAVLLPAVGAAITLPVSGMKERIALIQGNVPQAGLEFNAQRRAVLDDHVRGTRELLARETTTPQLIIWPENASDIDPLRNRDARDEIASVVKEAGVPLLIGAILDEPYPKISNVSLFYRPGHTATPQRYVKQHPVPFGEYIPFRSFFRLFSDKVDLVRADMAAGTHPAAFRLGSGASTWYAVPTICFEVAYDGLVRDAVTQPGRTNNLLVVQTNNATFGYTAESDQQFAISRIRAIEHGRSVAHVSTVGVSAIINPDGSVQRKTRLFTADQVVGDVVIRNGLTVSDRIGSLPTIIAGAGLAALVLLGIACRSGGRVAASSRPSRPRKEAVGV